MPEAPLPTGRGCTFPQLRLSRTPAALGRGGRDGGNPPQVLAHALPERGVLHGLRSCPRTLRAPRQRSIGADRARTLRVLWHRGRGPESSARTGAEHRRPREQFPSNVYAWQRQAAAHGCDVRTVDRPAPPPSAALWNERLLEAIGPDTAVVALPHCHWTDGTRIDLEAAGERAREVGAALVIDGSQSIGAVPFDVEHIRPDALITVGYKWLLGPYSTAFGYYGARFDDGAPLEETWISRRGSEDFQGLVDYTDEYREGAARYDVGQTAQLHPHPHARSKGCTLILNMGPGEHPRVLPCTPRRAGGRTASPRLGDGGRRVARRKHSRRPPPRGVRLRRARTPASRRLASTPRCVEMLLGASPNVYNEPRDIDAIRQVLATLA